VFNITFPSEDSLRKIYSSILHGHLQAFSKEVKGIVEDITTCTLELYKKVIHDLPPTPSKFHYIFNMRDLSRVTHGLCLTTPDRFNEPAKMVRVWRNECLRVYYDRLINSKDKDLVKDHVAQLIGQHFPDSLETASIEPILFGDYRNALNEQPRL
jgi:dynein heavy chain